MKINEVLAKSVSLFGRTKKEIRIQTGFHEPSPVVAADRRQIEQVCLNMFVNAWQALPDGGALFLETSKVVLDGEFCQTVELEPGAYAKISIKDTGIGMDEATRQRIFDPFFTTKEKSRGTGLGLASTYGIIKNHKGAITVRSKPGQGTTFNIFLPISEGDCDEPEIEQKDLDRGSETVLLVDDEEMVLDVGREMLERLGYRVMVAKDGEEAIQRIDQKGREIELVILDLIMPGLDGGKVFDMIREHRPGMPVILSSGYALEGQTQQIMSRGCNGFIQKPFSLSQLSQVVRRVLSGQE